MTSVMRPGRGDITTTRSDRYTASGMEWVTKTTVVPVSAQMRVSSACMCSRVISSRAPNGSSIRSRPAPDGQRTGDGHPLLHAARQLPGPVVGEVGAA